MYTEHYSFESPDDNDIIWRYMDFTKLLSILEKNALFFSRADKLVDSFEGSVSIPTADLRLKPLPEDVFIGLDISNIEARQIVGINSWHLNNDESAAMWKLYVRGDNGIAIQSRFHRLKNCFNNYKDEEIRIGKIKYIDYQADYMPDGNVYYPFLYKRKSFEYEKELRALIIRYRELDGKVDVNVFNKGGDYIPIDVQTLVENMYVSPTSGPWFCDLVKSILNKYGLKIRPIKSSLSKDPIY